MKKMLISFALLPLLALADTWTDPDTGITWTYTVSGDAASVGGGDWDSPAVSTSTAWAITIPSALGGRSVTSIGSWAFSGCSGLTSVTIPSSVMSIGESAFYGCSGLTSVTIPSGVTSIGYNAFFECSGLTSVTIPLSVTNIGELAFSYCSGLTSVTIPSSVASIGAGVFYGCSGLTSVRVPSSVTRIGDCAFYGCSGLKSVTIPPNVTSIVISAFYCCDGLTSVTVPGWKCGIDFSTVTKLAISDGTTSIGDYAFQDCVGLTSVAIPSGVTSIGRGAFFGCSGLTSVTIPSGVTSISSSAFYNCSGLKSVTIASGVTSIGDSAFSDCDGLIAVDFEGAPPEGVTDAYIKTDAAIRYNAEYEDEWLPVIEECGFTNATPYVPEPEPVGGEVEVAFVVPNGVSSMSVATYTNLVYGRLPEARREGFTFAGWYTSLDGMDRVSAFSAVDPKVKKLYARWVEDEAALYAQWEANRYSVSFNANGGEGEMAAQPFLYDQAQALSGSGFTKLGYTFMGWATNENGEVVYKNGQSVSNLTAEAGFAVALFAKWEKVIDVAEEEIEEWVGYTLAPKFKRPGETATAYRKRFEERFGDNYADAFIAETGKVGQDGTNLQVWHDYVAGTDPLDTNDVFTATIVFDANGIPKVEYKPQFENAAEADKREYKTWGKKSLTDEKWLEVPEGGEADYNFFKVTVEMK